MKKSSRKSSKYIYLDYAATTPVDERVLKSMQPYWSKEFANPSALYKSGVRAKQTITSARAEIAKVLNASSSEIVFTAGGTESNNMAILGTAQAFQKTHGQAGHIITTPIEHHSVLHVMDALKKWGWKISYVEIDKEGFVNLDHLKSLVRKDTVLISIMYANNEVGTIQPIAEIGKWLSGLNKARMLGKGTSLTKNNKTLPKILFHTDACQAAGALSLDTHKLKIDLLTLNGSKIYGPKQTGILYIRTGTKLEPIIHGGGQENNLRSGTENVPGIVGLATALTLAQKSSTKESIRLQGLQQYFVDRLSKRVDEFIVNGPEIISKTKQPASKNKFVSENLIRLPNNINISFNGVEGETLMLYLDNLNIAVATGSACATTSTDPSHVLIALGSTQGQAYSAIRFTMGVNTTKRDLDFVIEALADLVPMLRKVKSLN